MGSYNNKWHAASIRKRRLNVFRQLPWRDLNFHSSMTAGDKCKNIRNSLTAES